MKTAIIFLLSLLALNAQETNSKQPMSNENSLTSLHSNKGKLSDVVSTELEPKLSDKIDIKKLENNKVYTKGNNQLNKECSLKDRLNLVHIVKKVDNTTVEYWVDPYADNVNVDLQFTNIVSSGSNTDKTISSKESEVTEDSVNNKDQNHASKLLDSYLSNYENAHAYFYKKRYNKAHYYIDKAIAIDSEASYGYRFKGTIYYAQENYKKALETWKHAVELNPALQDVKEYINQLGSN